MYKYAKHSSLCKWGMGSIEISTYRPICISDHFAMILMDVNYRTWTKHAQVTCIYNQSTHVCTHAHENICVPKTAQLCAMHDMHVALNLWVTCMINTCIYVRML